MANAKLLGIIRKRDTLKARLDQFSSHVTKFQQDYNSNNKPQNKHLKELEQRTAVVKGFFTEFCTIQKDIELQVETDDLVTQLKQRADFENIYFSSVNEAEDIISEWQNLYKNENSTVKSERKVSISRSNTPIESRTQLPDSHMVKLPDITLPEFHGSYDQWIAFADTFNSLIHDNEKLSQIEKFYYLRTALRGEAAQVIQGLDISASNYAIAWKLLEKRYKNKKLMIHNHIKTIVEVPKINKESFKSLRQLFDTLQIHLRALSSLGEPVNNWSSLLIYLITDKFDINTQREWERRSFTYEDMPTIDNLTDFLETRCNLLEKIDKSPKLNFIEKTPRKAIAAAHVNTGIKCHLCSNNHYLFRCTEFLDKSVEERLKFIKNSNLCFNCLRAGHVAEKCNSGSCRICNEKHNSLLHLTKKKTENQQEAVHTANSQAVLKVSNETASVLLATAIVNVEDMHGNWYEARALLDSGSQSNFITAELAETLKIKSVRVNYSVSGINKAESSVNKKLTIKVHSRHSNYNKALEFLVIPQITCKLPVSQITLHEKLPNVNLADERFNQPGTIDLLIGAEVYFELLQGEHIKLGKHLPVLYKTTLGWVLSGPIKTSNNKNTVHSYHTALKETIEEFWKIEDFPKTQYYSKEETDCENHFVNTHTRDETGRFLVKLPLKQEVTKLGNSKEVAAKRQRIIERKFQNDSIFEAEYVRFMEEYEELKHMTRVEEKEEDSNTIHCYLPHHAVYKQTQSKKIRVVFDASSKTSSELSLNDILMVGPTIQQDLFSIILRFRQHKFVIVSDIVKMYRQILIHPDDRNLQMILWRKSAKDPIQSYELNTVTYGTASAPFLAIRCLHQLAQDNKSNFPEACRVIEEDFYVDDLLTGGESIEEVKNLKHDIINILTSAGFKLDKWASNCSEIVNDLPEHHLQLDHDESSTVKALGLQWSPKEDSICYKVQTIEENAITKRQILARIARLFDPLGLLGPVIAAAKIIMQSLWKLKSDWDHPVPEYIQNEWNVIEKNLVTITEISVPRCIIILNHVNVQIHGFADASEKAYGAAIYIRSCDMLGNIEVQLLCSRSRVAPLKKLSLPRLELCAALILARLYNTVKNALRINYDQIWFWSDSSITLYWIHTEPYKLKTFVANRVAEIQEITNTNQWRYVSSSTNPADILSRGELPHALKEHSMWWIGPSWLHLAEENWPKTNILVPTEDNKLLEVKTITLTITTLEKCELFDKYSSLLKLQRIVAYCYRFYTNSNVKIKQKSSGTLKATELQSALYQLIRVAQIEAYQVEMQQIKKNGHVSSTSCLKQLNPFIDKSGLLRVGGRLRNASIKYDQKFPIILPKGHKLTKLIILNEHEKLLHAGCQTVIASLRSRFWPIGAQSMTRKLLHNCVTCAKVSPREHQHLMGDLPLTRVTPARAFQNCGVDFCGPFLTKEYRRRGKGNVKSYIAVFVCFSTRAIHLELVTNLTSDAFLGALKRFVARRGKCQNIYCDNGTNFVGAYNELCELGNLLSSKDTQEIIENYTAKDNMQFHFIPPRSPHFGGLWEAAVKSAKTHLKRVASKAFLTFEEMLTLIAQVESCLNSRPLVPMSSDPEDFNALTPGHFLIGDAMSSIPEADITEIAESKLSHWQRVQALHQHFWRRWSTEFLSSLQPRSKWYKSRATLQPGDLVILKETTLPTTWKMGRILQVHPGHDQIVRVVTIKTSTGVVKRAANKICLLPVENTKTE